MLSWKKDKNLWPDKWNLYHENVPSHRARSVKRLWQKKMTVLYIFHIYGVTFSTSETKTPWGEHILNHLKALIITWRQYWKNFQKMISSDVSRYCRGDGICVQSQMASTLKGTTLSTFLYGIGAIICQILYMNNAVEYPSSLCKSHVCWSGLWTLTNGSTTSVLKYTYSSYCAHTRKSTPHWAVHKTWNLCGEVVQTS